MTASCIILCGLLVLLELDVQVVLSTKQSIPHDFFELQLKLGGIKSNEMTETMMVALEEAGFDIYQPLVLETADDYHLPADPSKCGKLIDFENYDIEFENDNANSNLEAFCPASDDEFIEPTPYTDVSLTLKYKIPSNRKPVLASQFRCDAPLIPSVIALVEHSPSATSCTIYEVGYQIRFDNDVERWHEVPKLLPTNFEWISLIEYCFDDLYFNAIYAHEVVYQNIIPSVEKSLERIEEYRLTENIKLKNIEYLYSRENQKKVFVSLFGENLSKKYFDPTRNIYLEKQELIDQKNHMMPVWKLSTLYYMNLAPMYKSIKDGSWRWLEEFIRSSLRGNSQSLLVIYNGTYEKLRLGGNAINLDPTNWKFLRVPLVFFKVLTLKTVTQVRSMAIITHNNPFEIPVEYICDEPIVCETYGWMVTNTRSEYGYTYCCKPTDKLREKFNFSDSTTDDTLLNLNTLQELITLERSYIEQGKKINRKRMEKLQSL